VSDRFKPVRAGIIGIWDYAEQEFRFADGHLVLRGPNGSGKTKALEVLVPFVLDGSIDPRRLDPFSGQERTMRSNLLYGGEKARLAYCWLELARGEEHVTVGVGLRAHAQAQQVKRWFFVADGVVGESIHLLTPERVPVTHKELRAQLGDEHVFKERGQHRAAVDRRLFELGEERYAAMLDLVLTLRRPQLAKDLDPDGLSRVLSSGLRTVDPELLRTSAAAFDHLEEAQRNLTELERAAAAVADLVVHWRIYLCARSRRRIEDVRERQGRVRATEHRLAETQRHIERQARRATEARAQVETAKQARDGRAAVIEALQARDAYKERGQLDDARQTVATAKKAAAQADKAHQRARKALHEAAKREQKQRTRRDQAATVVREAGSALRAQCRVAGHLAGDPVDPEAVQGWLVARRAAVEAVIERVAAYEEALRREEDTERRLQEAAEALRTWHAGLLQTLRESLHLGRLLEEVLDLGATADLSATVTAAWAGLAE